MTTRTPPSCTGWVLATAFVGMGLATLTAILAFWHYPQTGWLLPALGAGIWVSTALFWLASRFQREQPESDLHPLLYFLAGLFTVLAGGFIFGAAVYQPLSH